MNGSFLFLGTGGSAGIPVIGCSCSVCHSKDLHNKRMRPSGLFQFGEKKILIDTSPDFRAQALQFRITSLDGVLLTHTHYDHIAGIDELRIYYLKTRKNTPVLVSQATLEDLKKRYYYLFKDKSESITLAAQLEVHVLEGKRGNVHFLEIPFSYMSYEQGGMEVTGFRCGNFAYISDIREFPKTIFDDLQGVKTLVLSAIRHTASPMHFNLEEAIDFAKKSGAEQTFLTHIGHELDHALTNEILPKGVALAFDGLEVGFTYEAG